MDHLMVPSLTRDDTARNERLRYIDPQPDGSVQLENSRPGHTVEEVRSQSDRSALGEPQPGHSAQSGHTSQHGKAHQDYGPPRVRLVCRKVDGRVYDGFDFITYPERAELQWSHFITSDHRQFRAQESRNPSDHVQFEIFLQRWLFFGLLHAVLSLSDSYYEHEYIQTLDGIDYLTTRKLGERLLDFTATVKHRTAHNRKQDCESIHACLRRAWPVLYCLNSGSSVHEAFDSLIKTSIFALLDTLTSAWEMAYQDVLEGDNFQRRPANSLALFSENDRFSMIRRGWCQSVIDRELKDDNSFSFCWYIKHMQQYPTDMSHEDCPSTACNFEQITATYQPRHTQGDCTCPLIGPDPAHVAVILDRGNYPVLAINEDHIQAVKLDVLEYDTKISSDQNIPYVAISHVWADGMGNQTGMELPRCQVSRLHAYVRSLQNRTFTWPADRDIQETRTLYLWCDSLLCPVVPRSPAGCTDEQQAEFNRRSDVRRATELKMKALSHMRKVYMDAAYVLVLDRGLESLRYADMDCIEIASRILTSRWMQRLWTYQEAQLPVKLLIQFEGVAIDYRDIVLDIQRHYNNDILLRSICETLYNRLVNLRAFRYLAHRERTDLMEFARHLRWRRCTVRTDEPLCAAALINLDIADIDAAQGMDQRMARLWQLFAQREPIPSHLIFCGVPRIDLPGFRWAPSTFKYGLSRRADPEPAVLTDRGLYVRHSCWQIKAHALPSVSDCFKEEGHLQELTLYNSKTDRYFKLVLSTTAGHWRLFLINFLLWQSMRDQDWHLLLEEELSDANRQSMALLGTVDGDSSMSIFRAVILVQVFLLGQEVVHFGHITKTYDKTHEWCVDWYEQPEQWRMGLASKARLQQCCEHVERGGHTSLVQM